MMALVVPVPQAAAIMLPLLIAMDWIGLWTYRRNSDRANMRIMIPGAVIGTALGYFAFQYLDEHWIRLLIGAIAVGFTLNVWFRPALAGYVAGPSWPKGVF